MGLFDSGLGGISVARAVRAALPRHDLIYLADTAHCPYGPLPTAQVRARSLACARWLVGQGARVVVVACNTATSAAVELLRSALPVPIVGMEPGVKPAVAATRTGRVAVLATSGTLTGDRFARLVERFGDGVEVRTVACPEMVSLVEAGDLASPRAAAVVAGYVAPLAADGVDTLVLGCTHFPPLRGLIAAAAPGATIIDTGLAVAAQTARVAAVAGVGPNTPGGRIAFSNSRLLVGLIMPHILPGPSSWL
ncbi:MAG: glutamate racemase [Chloroflexales bacterium]|nr:glutamate racemase [Chloroflexales bacterium]